ncbi:MAG: ThuA domain-containing protein [Planctomycetaceae bacterium]
MSSRRTTWMLLCFTLVMSLAQISFAAEKLRVLMLTDSKGYRHGSVTRPEGQLSPAEIAVTQLGQQTELFTVDCTQETAADFTKENLKNYDIVIFYTTGELPIADADRDYFVNEWLKQKGHGFIGFHSAADTYRADDNEELNQKYKWYWDMLGGTFSGHPWNAGDTVTITVHDPEHPTMVPFGEEFTFRDEIYQYKNWQPEKVRVLMSLNMAETATKKPYHVPVAWVKSWGEGRIYFNNLGHNPETWTNPVFLKSVEEGIKWASGQIDGEATPNPEVSAQQEVKAKADAQ